VQSKIRFLTLTTFLVFTMLALVACAAASSSSTASNNQALQAGSAAMSITLTDALSRTVTLPAAAQRIISLSPAGTEILFAIGAGKQVVGRDSFSDYPSEAKAITDIGGGFSKLNPEVIIAQKPDLILASYLTASEEVAALEKLGLTIFVLPNPSDFNGLYSNIQNTGRLSGRETEATVLVDAMKQRVTAVEQKLANVQNRPLVFYELDGTDPNAPWIPGPGSFVANLIHMSGGENIGDKLQGEWAQVSIEQLIASNPDLILIGDATWGGVTLDDVRGRAGWQGLKAIQAGKLATFDDNVVSRPGPRLVDGLEAMSRLLHPELFDK
jgi:iron complex transport system substrate-binding protein